MRAVHLTLLCHALTQAQKSGRLAHPDDGPLRLPDLPLGIEPTVQLLTAPERRASESAHWAAAQAQVEPALADCDLGSWQGLPLKQLQAEQPRALAQWLEDPFSAPHGGESFAQVCERVGAWLMAFDRPGEWLAVTHPWVIRAALVKVLACPLAAAQRIDVLPLSRVELSFTGQWRLRLG
ncbi:histidine phosphatase family protein [Pseudomonas sp.]|uniref:histidine phosphatase family protein n=1 Tax=Pseudomonas sp. TaxID=306 RepID=UPI001B234D40|nr:histidine phosphatase family protein [Pseudomonas sp.]MBO9549690.1 histidine phosphatase family protein [Pseudomonas sp.]